MSMKQNKERKKLKEVFKLIKEQHLFEVFFIVSNLINGLVLRAITVSNGLSISPLLMDTLFLIIISLLSLLFKRKKRGIFLIIMSIIFNLICIINSIYYHYYSSYASFSLLATAIFAKDVGDAIVENVLQVVDFIYVWQIIFIIICYINLKKRNYFKNDLKTTKKKITK